MQPLGCFCFFPLTLSLCFSGWAGSNHSGSALRGGLWLSDHSPECVRQAHAVLAPFSHEYLPHQVRNVVGSVLLGWKYGSSSDSAGISVWVLQMASLNLQRTLETHRFSVLCRSGTSDLVLVCVAVTVEHRNVLLHTCVFFFKSSVKVWEWPRQFPSTAGDLLSLQGCEQLVDCQRSWNVSMQNI